MRTDRHAFSLKSSFVDTICQKPEGRRIGLLLIEMILLWSDWSDQRSAQQQPVAGRLASDGYCIPAILFLTEDYLFDCAKMKGHNLHALRVFTCLS